MLLNVLYDVSLYDDLIVLKNGVFIDDFFSEIKKISDDYYSTSFKNADMTLCSNMTKGNKFATNTYGIRLIDDPILLLDFHRKQVDLEELKLYIEKLPFEKEKLLIDGFNKARE